MALANKIHGYSVEVLRRPYQRSLSVIVRPNGNIRVTASRTVTERAIRQFLNQCEPWLKKVLSSYAELRKKYPPKVYLHAEGFLFLGQWRWLDFEPVASPKVSFLLTDGKIRCGIPHEQWTPLFHMVPQPQMRGDLRRFYKISGKAHLLARLQVLSTQMHLFPSAVSVRSQKTRWGSCSSQGRISLNWRLIAAPPETIDYVVIHELAHLRVPNHSAQFWNLVGEHSPQYRIHRQWLKDHQYDFDFLASRSELHPCLEKTTDI